MNAPTVASRLTTLTTHGLASCSSPSPGISAPFTPNLTTCKYVTCSFGLPNSVPCSSSAASRIITLTPSISSAPSFPSFPCPRPCAVSAAPTDAGSASTTASAGPETLWLSCRLRKLKCVKRRRRSVDRPFEVVGVNSVLAVPGAAGSPGTDASGPVGGTGTAGGALPLFPGTYSNLPSSSMAPSSNLRILPKPPSTSDSKTRSLLRPVVVDAGFVASGWSAGRRTWTYMPHFGASQSYSNSRPWWWGWEGESCCWGSSGSGLTSGERRRVGRLRLTRA